MLVILESPYAGDVERNVRYARLCLRDALIRGEAPLASHLLYTQALDDGNAAERDTGIKAGLAWCVKADATVAYTDLGISPGMNEGIARARQLGRPVEYRNLNLCPVTLEPVESCRGEQCEHVAEGRPVRKAERVGGWDGTGDGMFGCEWIKAKGCGGTVTVVEKPRCWCGMKKRERDVACCKPHELLAGRMG